jgi:hypothetical protein
MTARLSDLPHRQFEHLVVFVDDVEVAGKHRLDIGRVSQIHRVPIDTMRSVKTLP